MRPRQVVFGPSRCAESSQHSPRPSRPQAGNDGAPFAASPSHLLAHLIRCYHAGPTPNVVSSRALPTGSGSVALGGTPPPPPRQGKTTAAYSQGAIFAHDKTSRDVMPSKFGPPPSYPKIAHIFPRLDLRSRKCRYRSVSAAFS